jgi:cytochrome c556
MKSGMIGGIVVALCTMAGMALAQDVITQRREEMKNMGRQMEAIKAVTDARGDTRPLVERIDTMLALYRNLPTLFPAGSDSGQTRALPAIWSDRAGFEQMDATMITRLTALREAAASGDVAATTAAFGQVGASCGACHRAYRGPAR